MTTFYAEELRKISTVSPALESYEEKDLQNGGFVRDRCLRAAVDNCSLVGDTFIQYRPHDIPAKQYFIINAGDTVDILRGFICPNGSVPLDPALLWPFYPALQHSTKPGASRPMSSGSAPNRTSLFARTPRITQEVE